MRSNQIIHQSAFPLIESRLLQADSILIKDMNTLRPVKHADKWFVFRKLFHDHFISLDTGSVSLTIDPLVNFEIGREFKEGDNRNISNYFVNSRGFNMKLSLGDKLSFESSFRENQAVLPSYINERTNQSGVAFGQGRWKRFGENGYDYAMASAYISYTPKDWLNIQGGHGKNFIGNGYRSLLLSDLSFNYPYLRLNAFLFKNKVQYQSLFAVYQNLNRLISSDGSEGLFERKQAVSHFVEFKPNANVSIGLFESTIFPSIDSSGNHSIGTNYWIPALGLNTLLERDNKKGNSLIGTNINVKVFKSLLLYNQVALLGESLKDLSYQFGGKLFLSKSILIQTEANLVNVNTSMPDMFNNYNESLTHPSSIGVNEFIGILQYSKNRVVSRLSYHKLENSSNNIDLIDFRQSYVVNPSFNFALNLGCRYRNEKHKDPSVRLLDNGESLFLYFGLSTNLQNLYFDY